MDTVTKKISKYGQKIENIKDEKTTIEDIENTKKNIPRKVKKIILIQL